MRNRVALGAVAALLTGPALADGFSYNHIQADFIDAEIEDLGLDGDGFGVSGAVEFGPTIHGFGSISDTDYEEGINADSLSLGLGFNQPLAPQLDLVSGISYERLKINIEDFGSVKEEGFGLNAGLRGRIGDRLELSAGVKYVNYGDFDGDDDLHDTTVHFGGRYYATPRFALGLHWSENDDGDSWVFSLRYDLGNRY